jgi:putative glycosyltransferase (TIGR04372 family)
MTDFFFKKIDRIIEVVLSALCFPISLFFVIFIRLSKPFFLIRYAYIRTTRIGHMSQDIDFYVCARNEKLFPYKKKCIDIFYTNNYVCNKFLLKLLKQQIIIFPRFLMHPTDQINRFFDFFLDSEDAHTIGRYKKDLTLTPKPPWLNKDIYNFYDRTPPQFKINKKECSLGLSLLKDLGINEGDKYVLIYARDSQYLEQSYPSSIWSHHNYRNIDIDNFIPATQELIKSGYKVIRVGNIVKKRMSFQHKDFIDYPYTASLCDFMDIFLIANCNFMISTSSGLDCVAQMFRKKILFPCLCPIMDTQSSSKNHMLAYRHLIDSETKKLLTLKDILGRDLGYIFADEKNKAKNIELQRIDPNLIKEVTQEMILRVNQNFIAKNENKVLENSFFKLFNKFPKSDPTGSLWHKDINFQISHTFLEKNAWWLS